MKQVAIILIATLLVSCASAHKPGLAEEPTQLSLHTWQELQVILRDAPDELRRAITHAGELRLSHSEQVKPPNATELRGLQTVLLDLLLHASNQNLLPDPTFESINDVVNGDTQQLQQSFATALAGYLTQDNFSCQQPVFARYFERRYASVHPARPCTDKVPFSIVTQYEGAQIVWINLKRIKSIHLLFAGKSQSLASRFGHVSLRIVVCPEGKSTAVECDANLLEHLVLGFQANIDDLSLDTLKALNGKYKAYLFANQFIDVYQQYTIDEFREVYSLPLKLNETQREFMVRTLADIHWRYAGEYRFFTRNCATMLQDALRAAWPEFAGHKQMQSNYLRPDSIFEAIMASSLAYGDKLASLELAEREGHYFSSTRQFYERALTEVRDHLNHPEFTDIESYLQISPERRRQNREDDYQFSMLLASNRYLREAQIMLEEYSVLRSERLLLIEGARYLEQQDFLTREESIHSQLDALHSKIFDDCLLTPIKQRNSPMQRLAAIPYEESLSLVAHDTTSCFTTQNKKLLHEAIEGIKDTKSEQWQRLKDISQYWTDSITNLNLLKHM